MKPAVPQAIAVTDIVPSPFQHRKTFRGIEELAASLAAHGVQQPLKVRQLSQNGKYELVFGERRWRAATVAGLVTVPCFVELMDDATAAVLLTVENAQREDLDPLECAAGYRELRDKFQLTAEQIAERVHKSKATVYAMLKLTEACKPVQQSLEKGETTLSHAVLLARLPEGTQKEALNRRIHQRPVQELEAWIAEHSHRPLNQAPFRLDSAELVPAAGSCVSCPKRAGNNRDVYPNLKADTCTDPKCYAGKVQAHIAAAGAGLVKISTSYQSGQERAGILYSRQYQHAGGKCPHRKQAIVADTDKWDENKLGTVGWICAEKSCKIHWPQTPKARAESPAVAAKRKVETAVYEEVIDRLGKIKQLHKDDVPWLCKQFGGAGQLLTEALAGSAEKDTWAAAQRHKIDVAAIRKAVTAAQQPKAPPAKVQASAKAKPKAKAKKAKRKR